MERLSDALDGIIIQKLKVGIVIPTDIFRRTPSVEVIIQRQNNLFGALLLTHIVKYTGAGHRVFSFGHMSDHLGVSNGLA